MSSNAVVPNIDWRDVPHMAHTNCLALKICAIIQLVFTGLTLIISIVSAIRRKDAAVGSSLGITNLLGIATPCLGIAAMYTGVDLGDAAKLLILYQVYQAFIAMSLLMIIPFAISAASALATWVCQCKDMICDDDGLTREETVQGCKSFIDIIITLGSMLVVCVLQIIILVFGWKYAFGDDALYTLTPTYYPKQG